MAEEVRCSEQTSDPTVDQYLNAFRDNPDSHTSRVYDVIKPVYKYELENMFRGFELSHRFSLFAALSASGGSKLVLAGARHEAIAQMVQMEALSPEQAMLLRLASHTTPIVIIDAPPLPYGYRGVLYTADFQEKIHAILDEKQANRLELQCGMPHAFGSNLVLTTLALDWIVASYRFGTISAPELEILKNLLIAGELPAGMTKPTTANIIGRFHTIQKQP